MNHLHRDLAPISDAGWDVIDDEAKSRLPTYLAARKLVDFEGPHGWTHSATNLGRITCDLRARPRAWPRAAADGPPPGRAPHRVQGLPGRARRRRPRHQQPRPGRARRGDAPDRPGRERHRLPRPRGRRPSRHHREHLPRAHRARRGHRPARPTAWRAASTCSARPASTVPTGWPSAPTCTPASSRAPSTAGICCSTTCARSSAGPWSGRPASRAASCSASAAATSRSSAGRTSPSATSTTTPTSCASTSRRASTSGCSSPTPPWPSASGD